MKSLESALEIKLLLRTIRRMAPKKYIILIQLYDNVFPLFK